MNRIGLIGAMPIEVAPILEYVKNARTERVGPLEFVTGEICGVPVVVGCCGISKVNAAMGVQAMIQTYHPRLIIHMGVGGALTERLRIGDVVIARGCVQYDVDTSALGDPLGLVSTVNRIVFDCDERVSEAMMDACKRMDDRGFNVYSGIVATGDRFLTRAEEKRWIAETFGAMSCDQESCAIAQVCGVHQVPVAVVRSISDATDENHADEYESFLPLAAGNASSVVCNFLGKFGAYFL